MPPSRRDLDKLVSGAGSEIADEAPLRRGRGINGLLTETPAPPTPPVAAPAPPVAPPAPTPVDNPTSPHVDNTTPLPAEEPPAPSASLGAAAKAQPARKVASYRIDPDLARRVKIYAAMYDMNDYEVVEAALTAWLDPRDSRRAAG